ncbi:Sensory box histidine kinase/response regulator [Rubellimicrobium mesophilum DSM 19309]|uniref:histidine kinase n=1 Tax=Rubellimicrobium mesophilum DSM 19309 TaxID=442562 RepID=A0A017HKR6_9RHOB|nr:PAS domain-containing protein [Rubellimicrobium mesophilum]EYD75047.1 Sensory box histidine kinase/response regulator [Rubellimicrobium mesophilum DSM 19309]
MAQCVGILAPKGRDATVIAGILQGAGLASRICDTMEQVIADLAAVRIGALMASEEAFTAESLARLEGWLADQPPWSDLPILLLTMRNGTATLQAGAAARLGNVTILERPLHPVSLVTAARAALRARARQHEAERHIADLAKERAALRASEERYRMLFESIDEGFCVIEFLDGPEGPLGDYVHVAANPAYERHAGIPNVVGRRVREMVPDEAESWVARYGEVLRTGTPIRFEQELVATHRYLELSAFRVEPASRRQVAVLFQDVTARRLAEQRLRELNETLERRVAEALAERRLFADLVEGTDAMVQVLDRDFRWLAINRAAKAEFERVFGRRPRIGASLLDLLDHLPAQREALHAIWSRALAGEEFTLVEEFGDPSRDRRAYEMRFNVLRDPRGEVIGAYEFVHDVTERLRDQERLAEATARVHEMAKLETLGQLTGGVAHDFNNLLTPIVGALDILRRQHRGDQRTQRLIEGAVQGAERATLLVQRLLMFARRQHLETRAVDVGELVRGMEDLIRRSIGSHIQVGLTVAPDLPPAQIDPNQLELAVLNLAVNARDAMGEGGTLTVDVAERVVGADAADGLRSGRYVRLTVADTGQGMDAATLARAVEPFFTTKEPGKGTGLGLSMIHGLAAQSGGALRLESGPGRGTTAELWLPVSPDGVRLAADDRPGEIPQTRPAVVLLVDDDDIVRSATADMLRNLDHEVVDASTPAAALGMLRSSAHFDLLISDHLMPGMRGTRLIREARKLRPALPALLVTGYADLSDEETTDTPRLAKPFRETDLAKEIAKLL